MCIGLADLPDGSLTALAGAMAPWACSWATVTGTFQTAVTYDSGGQGEQSVVVADVNGDGRPDVFAANVFSNTIGVPLGNGDGTFQPAITDGSGGVNPFSVVVADVNGDRKPDLVTANVNPGTVGVLLGNGDGTFQVALISQLLIGARSASIADVNRDGKPDLLVASGSNVVEVLLDKGDGTFAPEVDLDSGGSTVDFVLSADVNGDGKPDLVVASCAPRGASGCGGDTGDGIVGVLLGNGTGTFRPV